MDESEAAMVIAHALETYGAGKWEANGLDIGEVEWTNEDGEKFRLSIEAVEDFD